MTAEKHLEPAPEPSAFDYGLTVAKIATLAFPFFGAGVALFDLITAPMRGKRLSEWCEKLRDQLNELSQKVEGLTPAKLAASEEFNSAFAQAAQAAIRTHQEEKLEALRNAVINTALSKVPDDNRRSAFLSLVDRFTTAHLQILKKLDNPQNYEQWRQPKAFQKPHENLRTPVAWVKDFVPVLADEDVNLIKMLIDDLQRAGLIGMKGDDPYIPQAHDWMTRFGRDFLRFISKPKFQPDSR